MLINAQQIHDSSANVVEALRSNSTAQNITASSRSPAPPQPAGSFPTNAFKSINQDVLGLDSQGGSHNVFSTDAPSVSIDPTTEAMLLTDPPMQLPLTDTDPMLDELWKNENFDPLFFDLVPEAYYNEAGNTCGFLPNIPEIVDEVDQSDILVNHSASATPLSTGLGSTGLFSADDSNLWAPESQLKTSAQITHERDHEMAFLIRHFTESVGPWYVFAITLMK